MSTNPLDETLDEILNGDERHLEVIKSLLQTTLETHKECPDLILGAAGIAKWLGISRRKAYHLLDNGRIPGAKKVGGTWAVKRDGLADRILEAADDPNAEE